MREPDGLDDVHCEPNPVAVGGTWREGEKHRSKDEIMRPRNRSGREQCVGEGG